jgi:hypothetical protein
VSSFTAPRQQLEEIARKANEVHKLFQALLARVPDGQDQPEDAPSEEIQEQQLVDLAWLIGNPNLVENYQGNYVAVYNKEIIAASPNEKFTRRSAIAQEPEIGKTVLIVPLRVEDGEELWEQIQAMLG